MALATKLTVLLKKMSDKHRKIETTLTLRHSQKFLKTKQRLGNITDANVLRVLTAQEYERIGKEEEARRERDYYFRTHRK